MDGTQIINCPITSRNMLHEEFLLLAHSKDDNYAFFSTAFFFDILSKVRQGKQT